MKRFFIFGLVLISFCGGLNARPTKKSPDRPAWIQSVPASDMKGEYIVVEDMGPSLEDLQDGKDAALAGRLSQISNVSGSIERTSTTTHTSEGIERNLSMTANFNSKLKALNYKKTFIDDWWEYVKMPTGGKTYKYYALFAVRYMTLEELQQTYAESVNKVISMLDVSARAEQEHKYDVALKYAYWALVLAYTLPEDLPVLYPKPFPGQDASGSIAAKLHARHRIEAILDGLDFKYVGQLEEDPLLGRLEVTCNGESVASLDYTYNDGIGISPSMPVKDGYGLIEFRANMDVRNIDIQVEYAYEDESNSDPEMKIALGEVSRIPFPDAFKRGISVSRKKPRPGQRKKHQQLSPSEQLASEVSAGFEQMAQAAAASASSQTASATPAAAGRKESATGRKGAARTPASAKDSSVLCLEAVTRVLDAIGRQTYSEVKELFTEEGYDTFEKLLHYGNAKILDRSHIQAVPYAYGYVCRSVPMKFSFKTNKKSFIENVVFWWDKDGKIDNLTFALDAESVKGILSKTRWTDGAKMAIISFLENYKTAFALARLDYIDAIFSDDALIIVGKVVKKARIEGGIRLEQEDVKYNRYTKAAYISQLRRSFSSKEYINLKFANTEITKLTRGGHENFYGIQLKQDYFSSNYGDSGYLYLLVDMEDSRKPLIYVRTWQPQPDPDFGLYGPGNI